MNFRVSIHAEQELQKRRIPREVAEAVVRNPQQKVPETTRVMCYQSRVEIDGKTYLLRVMVNEAVDPALVITVYRTSKISKCWSQP